MYNYLFLYYYYYYYYFLLIIKRIELIINYIIINNKINIINY